ncbi:UNKNOWN [Stylonychia lemnae]|uniref:Dickkopf N-terminal cysteine-rich domain-containing protein n=1 Tax=Stylonychia lemnae TaxID=5949 RepID=A0A078B9J8_STYLE|nr:UNKNOWN [Stylonychia lemnae]|eukprot:CDW91104.1 UNKNOWN [Stylonychia lemnae]
MWECQNSETQYCQFSQQSGSGFQVQNEGFQLDESKKIDYKQSEQYGFCVGKYGILKDMLPGQPCQEDFQCTSNRCLYGKCIGGYGGDPCLTETDCHAGYFCNKFQNGQTKYKVCILKKKLGDACQNDKQCLNHQICIPYLNINGTESQYKYCTERWQLQDGKAAADQRVCLNNTINDGRCSGISNVYQISDIQEYSPWPCDPEYGNGYCITKFNIALTSQTTIDTSKIKCQCSLFNKSEGYCQWPGQQAHQLFYQSAYQLYLYSPRCHSNLILDDPLYLDLFQIYQCTNLPDDQFEQFYDQWKNWKYRAPIESTFQNKSCLSTIIPSYDTQIYKVNTIFYASAESMEYISSMRNYLLAFVIFIYF